MTTQRSDALKKSFVLDRYQIESVLGDGGFGITYLATHIQGEWKVAIKEYLPSMLALRNSNEVTIAPRSNNDIQTYQDSLQQFLNEAKILSRFTEHPNIVTVRDFFEANGTAYLVMNYESGQTLDKWLLQNPHPTQEQLLQIFLPVLDGLRAIHAQDHLHRDIKPENIYIRSDGRPMLIDFGAARDKIGKNRSHTVRTVSDGFSPYEQYDSKSILGAWSDIYSIGATMWAMVTNGMEPVSALDRGIAIINEEPDPLISTASVAQESYSQFFLEAIDWALMFQPKKRPQAISEFQEILLQEWKITSQTTEEELSDINELSKKAVPTPKASETPSIEENIENKPKYLEVKNKIISGGIIHDAVDSSYSDLYKSSLINQQLRLNEPELVIIPSGSFVMGDEHSGVKEKGPAHMVNIQEFGLGKYPVTFAEFDLFCEATKFPKPDDNGWGRKNRPVINVSWNDVQLYIYWLQEVTGKNYRLPSEAEWEYVAYLSLNKISYKNINYARYIGKTTYVNQYPEDALGLYDIYGNIWEWMQDCWHDTYHGAPSDGSAWEDEGCAYRVLRGGSWSNSLRYLNPCHRYRCRAANSFDNRGFRICYSGMTLNKSPTYSTFKVNKINWWKKMIDTYESIRW